MVEAEAQAQTLSRLARGAGLGIKGDPLAGVANISRQRIEWLGLDFCRADGTVKVSIADKVWQRLRLHLQDAWKKPNATLLAPQVLAGWLNYLAPVVPHVDVAAVTRDARAIAAEMGFTEVQPCEELKALLQSASERYRATRRGMEGSLPDRRAAFLACRPLPALTPKYMSSVAIENECSSSSLKSQRSPH